MGTDRYCSREVRPSALGAPMSQFYVWQLHLCLHCAGQGVLKQCWKISFMLNNSKTPLGSSRAALGSSSAEWFQDVPELTGSSLLTYHKSHVRPTTTRVSSALFPHRNPRSGNEGNSLSLPFSPLGLISQQTAW